jgi:glycosyltransferase involved in cell wall biosynthesis
MRITFILSCAGLSGGVRIVRDYASRLVKRGHKVTIVATPYLMQVTPTDRKMSLVSGAGLKLLKAHLARWIWKDHLHGFEGTLLTPLTLSKENIPNADAIIATTWYTAEWLATYPAAKGKKFYLILGYEIWDGFKERVDATWKLPFTKIVISNWLKKIGEEQFGEKILGPFYHPVDPQLFHPVKRHSNNRLRVGMLFHSLPLKGFSDGLKAYEIARKEVPDLDLVLLSSERRKPAVPRYAEFHKRPPQHQLKKIYGSCDVWLCSSWAEGYYLPAGEAISCGCALVGTKVGCVGEIFKHEKSALVSEPKDHASLAANLVRALQNPDLRHKLVRKGQQIISQLTWENQVKAFEAILMNHSR